MVEHKPTSFATVIAFCTPVTLLIKLIRILLKWKYIQDKNYAILAPLLRKWSCLFSLSKKFRPSHRAGVFIWENFHPGYRDVGQKSRDFGNRASPASHVNTSKFLRRKEWGGEISETEPARFTGLLKRPPGKWSKVGNKNFWPPFNFCVEIFFSVCTSRPHVNSIFDHKYGGFWKLSPD